MTIRWLHQHGNITFRRSHLRDHSVKWFINFFRSLYSIFLSAHWQIKQPARSKSRHDTQSFILDVPSDASQFNHCSREENRFMVYDSAPLKKKLSHESCDYKSLFNCYQIEGAMKFSPIEKPNSEIDFHCAWPCYSLCSSDTFHFLLSIIYHGNCNCLLENVLMKTCEIL